ncbi:MAG: glycoside hydrolase [Bacteroidia bacterium]|nr:glycoside hydrolase [Bacteroidia bacterium]
MDSSRTQIMILSWILPAFITTCSTLAQSRDIPLFQNKKDGYPVFRIPAIIRANNNRLIAFAEGRKSLRDHGNIDLVYKISDDSGKSWSNIQVLWNDGKQTCGNPTPVFDEVTCDVLLIATLNNDRMFVFRSQDNGNTWSIPQEITSSVKENSWSWIASGPGHAIQLLRHSSYRNRILIPCNHTTQGSSQHRSHVIFSDDNGKTWKIGGLVPSLFTDECMAVELSDGTVLLNMRNQNKKQNCRKISLSHNGGQDWTIPVCDSNLVEPTCQASILSATSSTLYFLNPRHAIQRKNLTLQQSTDDGKTWQLVQVLRNGKSAYSDMVELPNGAVLCVYEAGRFLPYSGIFYQIINLK